MPITVQLDPKDPRHQEIIKRVSELRIPTKKKPNKVPITIRLDPDVLEALRAMGPGWQPKTNAKLRKMLRLPAAK